MKLLARVLAVSALTCLAVGCNDAKEGENQPIAAKTSKDQKKAKTDPAKIAALIKDLDDRKKQEAASDALVEIGAEALPALERDMHKRCAMLASPLAGTRDKPSAQAWDLNMRLRTTVQVLLRLGPPGKAAVKKLTGYESDSPSLVGGNCRVPK